MNKNYFLLSLLIFSASNILTESYNTLATQQEAQRLQATIDHLQAELEENNNYLKTNPNLPDNVIIAIKKSNEGVQNLITETKALLQTFTQK